MKAVIIFVLNSLHDVVNIIVDQILNILLIVMMWYLSYNYVNSYNFVVMPKILYSMNFTAYELWPICVK